jgi:CheY-like chemotaxis protein
LPASGDSLVSAPEHVRSLHGARILVIEDEFLIAAVVEDVLTQAGAREVIVAMGAKDGFAALSGAEAIDAAVIDIQLNEGTDAGYALAEATFKRDIPFVFLTGYSHDLALPEPFSAVRLLTKPYAPQALVQALNEAMQRARAAQD